MIELKNLCAGYPGHEVLHGISLVFRPGEVLVLIGPNGCGKSTLLKAATGLLPRSGGQIMLDSMPLESYKPKQIAQRVAYLPQSRPVPDITARRMVLHGRFPYLSYPRRYRQEDYAAVDRALVWADASDLADIPVPQLSGGQRQKVYLAMALAQETQTILMDEPTTYLDVSHQLEVMAVARRLAGDGKAVVLVLHDLCMALQCADEVAVLSQGRVVQAGTPEQIYSGGALEWVMGVILRRVETENGWRYYYLTS